MVRCARRRFPFIPNPMTQLSTRACRGALALADADMHWAARSTAPPPLPPPCIPRPGPCLAERLCKRRTRSLDAPPPSQFDFLRSGVGSGSSRRGPAQRLCLRLCLCPASRAQNTEQSPVCFRPTRAHTPPPAIGPAAVARSRLHLPILTPASMPGIRDAHGIPDTRRRRHWLGQPLSTPTLHYTAAHAPASPCSPWAAVTRMVA